MIPVWKEKDKDENWSLGSLARITDHESWNRLCAPPSINTPPHWSGKVGLENVKKCIDGDVKVPRRREVKEEPLVGDREMMRGHGHCACKLKK